MPIPTVLAEFQPNQPASAVSASLKQAVHTMDRAKHCAVLWFADIMDRGLYHELGYATIQLYARQELGFSSTRTSDFVRMALKLDDLPAIKHSLASGKIGYTKAREIIKIATPATEKTWVKAAQSMPRRQLEQKVARVRRQAKDQRHHPNQSELLPTVESEVELAKEVSVHVQFEMTPEQFARYEALLEKITKQGKTGKRAAMILEGLESLLVAGGTTKNSKTVHPESPAPASLPDFPQGTPFQIHVHQCPDCGRFSLPTSRGDLTVGPADSGRISCDARIDNPNLGPNHHTIAPSVRRRVLARDEHRCQTPGCTNTRFLEVHHIVPRSGGGSNHASNLVTLCSACHRHAHRNDIQMRSNGEAEKAKAKITA